MYKMHKKAHVLFTYLWLLYKIRWTRILIRCEPKGKKIDMGYRTKEPQSVLCSKPRKCHVENSSCRVYRTDVLLLIDMDCIICYVCMITYLLTEVWNSQRGRQKNRYLHSHWNDVRDETDAALISSALPMIYFVLYFFNTFFFLHMTLCSGSLTHPIPVGQ